MPLISIIVPVYNVEKYIHRCIDSIIAQTFTDFECILIDDGSPDNSSVICDEYAEKDSRIKVVHNEKNIGSSVSRKIGLDKSCGEYILFIDADDYVEPDMLEKIYTKAVSENYDMVYCDFYKYNEWNNIYYVKMPVLSGNFFMNIRSCTLSLGTCRLWNKLIKRSIYNKVQFPVEGYLEDMFITTQTLFFCKSIGYVNTALYHHEYNQFSQGKDAKRGWNRYKEGTSNYKKMINFLRINNGKDLSVFEPELSKRKKHIKKLCPITLKKVIKKVLRIIVPVRK